MKNILLVLLVSFLSAGFFSCSGTASAEKVNKQNTDQLYEKYKQMVTEGEGCAPCIDCAALALAMSYNTEAEITASKQKLLIYYKENGKIPCPELLPGLKKEIALMANSE